MEQLSRCAFVINHQDLVCHYFRSYCLQFSAIITAQGLLICSAPIMPHSML
jgi:hypothetical protein